MLVGLSTLTSSADFAGASFVAVSAEVVSPVHVYSATTRIITMMTTITRTESFSKLPIASSKPDARRGDRAAAPVGAAPRRFVAGVYGDVHVAQPESARCRGFRGVPRLRIGPVTGGIG